MAVLDLTGTRVSAEERRNVSIRLVKAVSDTYMAEGMARGDKWRTALSENAGALQNCSEAGCAQEAGKLLAQKTNTYDPIKVLDISDAFAPRPVASLNVRKTGDWILPVGDYALVLSYRQIATALIAPYR